MTRLVAFEVRRETAGPGGPLETLHVAVGRARPHRYFESVVYQGQRFQLFGGIRGPYFINRDRPLPTRRKTPITP